MTLKYRFQKQLSKYEMSRSIDSLKNWTKYLKTVFSRIIIPAQDKDNPQGKYTLISFMNIDAKISTKY